MTHYEYDKFGRTLWVDAPNGGLVTTDYAHVDGTAPNYIKTTIEAEDGDIVSYRFFDGFGRTIQSISPSMNSNKYVVTLQTYDNMGREEYSFGPYFSYDTITAEPANAAWVMAPETSERPETKIVYDPRGRVDSVVSYDKSEGNIRNLTVDYEYTGYKTTVTDPDGKKRAEVKNFLGQTVEVIEDPDSGNIHTYYTYNAAGDLLTVTDAANNVITNQYDTLGRKRYMDDPDMGVWTYTYDKNGNLETQKDANGKTITFEYDEIDRIRFKRYSSYLENPVLSPDLPVEYVYDLGSNGAGRLYQVIKAGDARFEAETTYAEYDAMGRVTEVIKAISGIEDQTTRYEYDIAGRLDTITYPAETSGGDTINYKVDYDFHPASPLLSEVNGFWIDENQAVISSEALHAQLSDYTPSGKIGFLWDNSDAQTTYVYEKYSERLTGIQTVLSNSSIQDKSYVYTQAGNIDSITDNLSGVTYDYEYDALHRLKGESYSGTGIPESFATADIIPMYDNVAPVHAVKEATINLGIAPYAYDYDANGNMVGGWDFTDPQDVFQRTMEYNMDNMPTQIVHAKYGTTKYTYDGEGTRVKKVVNDTNTTYYINDLYEIKNNSSIKYIFAGNLRIAMIDSTGAYYFQKDHLGSTAAITKHTGTTGTVHDDNLGAYLPFGGQRGTSTISKSDYAFTDQERDAESGLYNYNARLYDPVIGQFIAPDSIVPHPFNPQSLNRYSYCLNNPLVYVDPSGHESGDPTLLPPIEYTYPKDPPRDPYQNEEILKYLSNIYDGGSGFVYFDYGDSYSLNLLNPNDTLYDCINNIPNKAGKFIVGGHGDPDNADYILGPNREKLNAQQLAVMIRNHPKYVDGTPVDLLACETGRTRSDGGDPFALQLARILGVAVRAPTTRGWPTASGTVLWYGADDKGNFNQRDPGRLVPFSPND